MVGYWPTADSDPEEPAPIRDFAAIWRDMPKYVYSRTLQSAEWNTTVVREIVPPQGAPPEEGGGRPRRGRGAEGAGRPRPRWCRPRGDVLRPGSRRQAAPLRAPGRARRGAAA